MKNKKVSKLMARIGLLVLVLTTILSVPACAQSTPETITLKAQSALPPLDMTHQLAIEVVYDAFEEACAGRILLERHPEGALAPCPDMLTATGAGLIDLAPQGLGMAGELPQGLNELECLSGVWTTGEDAFNIYYQHGLLELFRDFLMDYNVYYIGPLAAGSYGYSTSFPVSSLKDFKGKKIRSGAAIAPMTRSIEAVPADIPFGEIYMALTLGTIDGVCFTYPELESMKWNEVIHYVIQPALISPAMMSWLMNLDTWKALDPDIQQIMEDVVKDQFIPTYNAQIEAEQGIFADPRITVVQLPPEDVALIQQIAEKMWYDSVESKGPLGAKAIGIIRDYYASK